MSGSPTRWRRSGRRGGARATGRSVAVSLSQTQQRQTRLRFDARPAGVAIGRLGRCELAAQPLNLRFLVMRAAARLSLHGMHATADRATSLLDGLEGPFDLVVSNPPYVGADEIDALEPEVRDWEPRIALVGDIAALLAQGASRRLAPGGALVLESHAEKTAELAAALESLGYENTMITRDLAGRERVVEARWT